MNSKAPSGSHWPLVPAAPRRLAAAFGLFGSILLASVVAAGTQWAVHDSTADFAAGEAKGVAILPPGRLEPGPSAAESTSVSANRLWDTATLGDGSIAIASGDKGELFVLHPGASEAERVYAFDAAAIQRLAVDGDGRLFAATNPDGKVYRFDAALRPDAKPVEVFAPEARYVWDLLVRHSGELLVATGDPARVYQVDRHGEVTTLLETDEAHVLCLTESADGVVYAGTANNGYVFRIKSASEHFVVWDAPVSDVVALQTAPDGGLDVLATGQRDVPQPPTQQGTWGAGRPADAASRPMQSFHVGIVVEATRPTPEEEADAAAPSGDDGAAAPPPAKGKANGAAPSPPAASRRSLGDSGAAGGAPQVTLLVHLDARGAPEIRWTPSSVQLYSMIRTGNTLLLGAGDAGRLFSMRDGERDAALATELGGGPVVSLRPGPKGRITAAVNDDAMVFTVELAEHGAATYRSAAIDAGVHAHWGRIVVRPSLGAALPSSVRVRTGNTGAPNDTWSPWSEVSSDGHLNASDARFLQYELQLSAAKGEASAVDRVDISYLPINLAPTIDSFEVSDRDVLLEGPPAVPGAMPNGRAARAMQQIPMSYREVHVDGMRSAHWSASDGNGDELRYRLEYRKVDEVRWKLLADDLDDNFYSWDVSQMADGTYLLRLTADDGKDNPAGAMRSTTLTSDRFEIDLTPPLIQSLEVHRSGDRVDVSFQARDAATPIQTARYFINGRLAGALRPVDDLFDEELESFRFEAADAPHTEATLTVSVEDQEGNHGTAAVVIPAR